MPGRGEWEDEAENWIRWARTPGHDAYWAYRASFFEAVVPPPGRRTVEIGCGEGRVSRDLRDRGHRTVGVELSPTLVAAAAGADPDGRYIRADAAALPLGDGVCDLVVAYNSLMDIADMAPALSEAGRILVPGGRLCICVTHPTSNAGRFTTNEPDAPFVVTGTYFGRRRFEMTETRDGLSMTFRGWSYSLEQYAAALAGAGFVIETVREPVPAEPSGHLLRFCRIPMFLHIGARRS
ncbi:MAG: class I SAM-dependent methyltransferase [Acidimicrobiales bacterium]